MQGLDSYFDYTFIIQPQLDIDGVDMEILWQNIHKDTSKLGVTNDAIEFAHMNYPKGVINQTFFVYKKHEYTKFSNKTSEEVDTLTPSQWVDGWTVIRGMDKAQALKVLEAYHNV